MHFRDIWLSMKHSNLTGALYSLVVESGSMVIHLWNNVADVRLGMEGGLGVTVVSSVEECEKCSL